MKRLPVLFFVALLSSIAIISCEDYYEDNECTCPQGGEIGGWEEPDDTTSIINKDTTGGFDITLDSWDKPDTYDICI